MHVIDELRARGLVELVSSEDALRAWIDQGGGAAYLGADPTASSLHLGNLVPVMMLAHLQRAGVRPVALVGGATGMIGDPSGRDTERKLLTPEDVQRNCDAIGAQLTSFLRFDGPAPAMLVNNNDWIGQFSFIDWLRDVGKYFTVNYMIAKESVRRRLEERDQGISYTEFSYMMLQAYDFLHLRTVANCGLQVGGNDQWGNITAGIDLVHKRLGEQVFGMTCPLMTTASGEKFGKSAGNAVWLDPAMTSPYAFYQYWMRTEDADVGRWLRAFTFLPLDEIDAIVAEHMTAPERRGGQKRLAAEITQVVHGESGLASALRASAVLFGGDMSGMSAAELTSVFADVPSASLSLQTLVDGLTLTDLMAEVGFMASRGEARRAVKAGGVYANNERVSDGEVPVTVDQLVEGRLLVLRHGKKQYFVVRFE
jgi:tyrosyl-tRNA synthetase